MGRKNSILNCIIDQKLRPTAYNQNDGKGNVKRFGYFEMPSALMEVISTIKDKKTPDPYMELALATGFITEFEITSGKLAEIQWSMKKILNNFGVDSEQAILTSPNCNFRENIYKVGTIGGFLYNQLSTKTNPKTMVFEFKRIYEQMSHHNYVVQIAEGVADRYIEDYNISTTNRREKVQTYDRHSPTKNESCKKKWLKSLGNVKLNKDLGVVEKTKYEKREVDSFEKL